LAHKFFGKSMSAFLPAFRFCVLEDGVHATEGLEPRGYDLLGTMNRFTVCVLLYGDHFELARRCLGSLERSFSDGHEYVVDCRLGLNEACEATYEFVHQWAERLWRTYAVPTLVLQSEHNILKYPMMRRMFYDAQHELAELVMWFDDDSFLEGAAEWWRHVPGAMEGHDMIGQHWHLPMVGNQWRWIEEQPWFEPTAGLPPRFGGRRAFRFCQGGWWVIRQDVLTRFDWPIKELRHDGGDSILGELCRHQGLRTAQFSYGVRINADESGRTSGMDRRGSSEGVIGKDYEPGKPIDLSHQDFIVHRIEIGDWPDGLSTVSRPCDPDTNSTDVNSAVIRSHDRDTDSTEGLPVSIHERHQEALSLQKAGNLLEAERRYREILADDPDHADSLQFLGVIAYQVGRHEEAVDCISKAIALGGAKANYHSNLGLAYQALQRLDDAASCFEHALKLKPSSAVAYNNLGAVRLEQGRPEDAAYCFRQSRRLNEKDPETYNNLGKSLRGQGKVDQAIEQFQKAIEIAPDFVEAHCRLGAALRDQNRLDEAIAEFQQALELAPDNVDALNSLGAALTKADKPDQAESHLRRAIEIKPDSASALSNLGITLMEQGRLNEAQDALEQSLRIKPDFAAAKSNLGTVCLQQGKIAEAIETLEDALRIRPDDVDAHWNRSLALLATGDFPQGWLEYEWRWLKPGKRRSMPRPLWDDRPLEAKTILLHAEQGLGDTIQFVRYARLVAARGGKVMLACQKPLVPLLSQCPEIDQVVAQERELPVFDVHAPLMSLPSIFKTTIETVPAATPYLHADPELVEMWKEALAGSGTFNVGIAWQGNSKYRGDRTRSIPLRHFAAIAQVEGVRLFSLQKGDGTEQLDEFTHDHDVVTFDDMDQQTGAFMDTAAIMKNLDLVITSDTVIPHLAGGLGVNVWMAVSTSSDWRWMLEREDSPWYPTMRIFRQRERGNWDEVFDRISHELRQMVGAKARTETESGLSDTTHVTQDVHTSAISRSTELSSKNSVLKADR